MSVSCPALQKEKLQGSPGTQTAAWPLPGGRFCPCSCWLRARPALQGARPLTQGCAAGPRQGRGGPRRGQLRTELSSVVSAPSIASLNYQQLLKEALPPWQGQEARAGPRAAGGKRPRRVRRWLPTPSSAWAHMSVALRGARTLRRGKDARAELRLWLCLGPCLLPAAGAAWRQDTGLDYGVGRKAGDEGWWPGASRTGDTGLIGVPPWLPIPVTAGGQEGPGAGVWGGRAGAAPAFPEQALSRPT